MTTEAAVRTRRMLAMTVLRSAPRCQREYLIEVPHRDICVLEVHSRGYIRRRCDHVLHPVEGAEPPDGIDPWMMLFECSACGNREWINRGILPLELGGLRKEEITDDSREAGGDTGHRAVLVAAMPPVDADGPDMAVLATNNDKGGDVSEPQTTLQEDSTGAILELLPVGTRVQHKRHPELIGTIKRWEYHESGKVSPIPYLVEWDNFGMAQNTLGALSFYQGPEAVQFFEEVPLPAPHE